MINNQHVKAKQPGMVIKQIKEYYICSSNKTSQKTKTHLHELISLTKLVQADMALTGIANAIPCIITDRC